MDLLGMAVLGLPLVAHALRSDVEIEIIFDWKIEGDKTEIRRVSVL